MLGHGLCHKEGCGGQYCQYTLTQTQQGHQETEDCKPWAVQSLVLSQVTAVGGPIVAILYLLKVTMRTILAYT